MRCVTADDHAAFDPLAAVDAVPHEQLAVLRSECPVSRAPDGTWYLARHADVVAASRDVDRIESAFLAPNGADIDSQFLPFIAEPEHGKVRRVINAAIATHRLSRIEAPLRTLCQDLLASILFEAQCDLAARYVAPIPAAGIGFLLGLPDDDQSRFVDWAQSLFGGSVLADADSARESRRAMKAISAYLDEQIAARAGSTNPPDDFISRLINTEVAGIRLSPLACRTQLIFLLVAGTETTRNLLANSILRLATEPALLKRLRANPQDIAAFIEESLRVDPPLTYLLRRCNAPVTLGGVELAADETVAFGLAAANRDERVFATPNAFDIDRPNLRSHLAFGDGPHICPGAALARLEARVGIEVLIERVESLELEPGFQFESTPVPFTNGPLTLPVRIASRRLRLA